MVDSVVMFVLIVVGIGLLILVMVGIVKALAWVAGNAKHEPDRRLATCPNCGRAAISEGRCQSCGWAISSAQPVARVDELAITAKQLSRLHQAGLIDQDTLEKAMQGVRAAKEAMEPARVSPTIPSPVVPPLPALATPASRITPPPLPVRHLRPASVVPAMPVAAEAEPVQPKRVLPLVKERRTSMAELLARFMEESNIRWGELVGGLLIVGCSIALVFTFWGWIESRPWVKFFLFTAVTAGVFLAGIYTERRWKLPHTSKGLLLIATLLVPLNFLAIEAFSQGMGAVNPARVVGEVVALGLFGWLVWMAGRVLVPDWAGLLSIGMLGASMSQGIVHRLALPWGEASAGMTLLLAAIPLAFYCGTHGVVLGRLWRRAEIGEEEGSQLLRFLGATSFAAMLPLGLLAYMTDNASWVMQRTAALVCLGGLPALGSGLLMWRRMTDAKLAGLRVAGTSIGVVGALILVGAMAMAWPNPAGLLPVALVDFAALTAVAVMFQIPAAHVLGLACAVAAYLLGFHLILPASNPAHITWSEEWRHLALAMVSPQSAGALVGCFGLLAAATELWRRAGRREDAWYYGLVSVAVAVGSLGLASWHGLWRADDHGATWVFAIYAVAAYGVAWRMHKPQVSWVGSVLLAVALVQGLAFRFCVAATVVEGVAVAMLVHASVMAAAGIARPWRKELSWAGVWTSIAGLALVLANLPDLRTGAMGMLAGRVLWVAAIWLVLAAANGWPAMFTVFQAALTAGAGFAVLAGLQEHAWFANSRWPLGEAWTLQAVGIAWATMSVGWVGVRRLMTRRADGSLLQEAVWFDRWMTGVVLAGLVGMALWAVWPGVEAELSTQAMAVSVHPQAWGMGAWMLLAAVVVALAAGIWERFNRWAVLGVVLSLACACPLIAARWEGQTGTASALRWAMAAFLLVMSGPVWVWGRATEDELRSAEVWRDVRTLVLALTVPFVLMLTLVPAGVLLSGGKIVGAVEGSFFARIGDAGSYLPPLVAVIAALVGYGLRERSAGFAFAASLVLNLTVTLAYLLALVTAGVKVETVEAVRLAQFNAIAAAGFALAWMGARRWPVVGGLIGSSMLQQVQALIGVVLLVCLLVPAELSLVGGTEEARAGIAAVGGGWGWLAWALAGAAMLWMGRQARWAAVNGVAVGLLVVGSMGAFSVCGATGSRWIGQHTLLAARVAAAGLVLGFGLAKGARREEGPAGSITRWATIFGVMALALAFRASYDDPTRPTWAMGGMIAVSLLSVGLAFWTGGKAWCFPAGLLLNAAATVWWILEGGVGSGVPVFGLVQVNSIVFGLAGVALLVLELGMLRPMMGQVVSRGLSYHRFAARAAMVLVMGSAIVLLLQGGTPRWGLAWAGMAAAWGVMIGCLWDIDARFAARGIYGLGLAGMAAAMAAMAWRLGDVFSYGAVALAGYSVVGGYLFTMRRSLLRVAEGVGIPQREDWPVERPGWVARAMATQAVVVVLLALGTVLGRDELPVRLAAATGVIAAATGMGLLAKDQVSGWLHRAALLLGVIGAVLWGWGWMKPGTAGEMLDRTVVVMVVTAGMAAFYAVGMVKMLRRENAWTEAAKGLVPIVGAAMVASLMLVLGVEWLQADSRGTAMAWWGIVAVLAALGAIGVAAIVCAVVPGRDPLELSERERTAYVYAAEVVLALIFLHLRLNFPEIFARGIFLRYWPFIIMAIAFAGVGLSEVFRRQGRMVLVEPLEKTGVFLPVLPVLAYWGMRGTPGFNELGQFTYANVLFVAGLLYAALALTRKSYGFGVMAALMANGGLWAVWGHVQGLEFLQHPQLWLVPAALSVLAAAHLNRGKLAEEQLKVVRYAALMVIYVSSTADIWINGVRENPWLPLVLAVLAVGGVMVGILLRVQSFLFLGTLFLVVAISSMIHYAAVTAGSNWPWMVAGIGLGVGIVAVFGMFEKKKQEMVGLVEGLKRWER